MSRGENEPFYIYFVSNVDGKVIIRDDRLKTFKLSVEGEDKQDTEAIAELMLSCLNKHRNMVHTQAFLKSMKGEWYNLG